MSPGSESTPLGTAHPRGRELWPHWAGQPGSASSQNAPPQRTFTLAQAARGQVQGDRGGASRSQGAGMTFWGCWSRFTPRDPPSPRSRWAHGDSALQLVGVSLHWGAPSGTPSVVQNSSSVADFGTACGHPLASPQPHRFPPAQLWPQTKQNRTRRSLSTLWIGDLRPCGDPCPQSLGVDETPQSSGVLQ